MPYFCHFLKVYYIFKIDYLKPGISTTRLINNKLIDLIENRPTEITLKYKSLEKTYKAQPTEKNRFFALRAYKSWSA